MRKWKTFQEKYNSLFFPLVAEDLLGSKFRLRGLKTKQLFFCLLFLFLRLSPQSFLVKIKENKIKQLGLATGGSLLSSQVLFLLEASQTNLHFLDVKSNMKEKKRGGGGCKKARGRTSSRRYIPQEKKIETRKLSK